MGLENGAIARHGMTGWGTQGNRRHPRQRFIEAKDIRRNAPKPTVVVDLGAAGLAAIAWFFFVSVAVLLHTMVQRSNVLQPSLGKGASK